MLKNKIIIVTGGSGLLGQSMMSHLHANGAVPINFDINVEADLENLTWTCDITNDASIRDSVQAVISYYGRIDGLVNNAYPRTPDFGSHFEDVNPESWRKNVDCRKSYIDAGSLGTRHRVRSHHSRCHA